MSNELVGVGHRRGLAGRRRGDRLGRRRGVFLLFDLLAQLFQGTGQRLLRRRHAHTEIHAEVHAAETGRATRLHVPDGLSASKDLEAGNLSEQSASDLEIRDHSVIILGYGGMFAKWLAEVLHKGGGGRERPSTTLMHHTPSVKGVYFPVWRFEIAGAAQLQETIGKHHRIWWRSQNASSGDAGQKVEQWQLIGLPEIAELHFDLNVRTAADREVVLHSRRH